MKEDTAPELLVLLITTDNAKEAHKIADELLGRRQAACVNIVPAVSSFFRWQGRLDSAHENLLIVKTKASMLDEVIVSVKRIHSYDVPEIIALPVVGGNQDYLAWVSREVG